MRRAIYPGSFDPITNGHVDLVHRASHLFDEVLVAVSGNSAKTPLFSTEERRQLAAASLVDLTNVKVTVFEGLLVDFVAKDDFCAIIRGLRAVSDFEYEFQMALMNRKLFQKVETVFMMPSLKWVYLSSSIIKEVARHQGDIKDLVPEPVYQRLRQKFAP